MQEALGQNAYYSTLLDNFAVQYFSAQQRELSPLCVIQPESTKQVSQAITIIREQECIFTVRSGGHGSFAGSSSVHGGIVIDLSRLNDIKLSKDESTALIGTGSRWQDIYRCLEERGLAVTGARGGSVGVGGFTLGGGISFISCQYGWALDNVRNFEVVLANGSIVDANYKTYPDLTTLGLLEDSEGSLQFFATKIVKWIHRAICLCGFCVHSTDIIDFFVQLAGEEQKDRSADAFIFLSWSSLQKSYLAGATILYSEPTPNPPVFRPVTSLRRIYTSNRLANMSNFALEMENPDAVGDRQVRDTATFKVNSTLISGLWDIFLFELDSITKIPGTSASCDIQLLTKDEILLFSRNGGNSLGINVKDGPLMLFSVTISYKEAKDDKLMNLTTQNIISKAEALGKRMQLYHQFIYQNYAGHVRDVFGGYGAGNRERLLHIQRKYDPDNIFQRLQPGYFKL
ncbi:hypothetical protein F5884DRAFT_905674 [Xylogone sp. PMI_703]|nr:hypothetical protein F5884DRAFT_905674 [Xylogone sp. PMI_703]